MGPARGNRKEKKRKHSMRNKLLVSTAALLAGVAIASAQDMGGKSSGQSGAQGGAQTERGSAGASHEQGRAGQAQRGESKQGQSQQRGQAQEKQTTGQAQPGQNEQKAQQGKAQQSQAQAGNVTLNAQQRTTIRQTVLAGSNVPRVNNVNFALSVGTVVPTSVRFVDVPPALIEINSAWRGHQYFVVRDDIVIVDHSRKIVAVVPVGSGGGASLGGGGAAALKLSPDQIREIQIVLNERGFNVGRPDGHLGKRTIEALTTFQRQQGFQATGRIDSQTVSALGLSNKIGAQGGATSGQGGAGSSQGGAQHQGASQPSAR